MVMVGWSWLATVLQVLVVFRYSCHCHGLSATSRAKRRQRGLVQTGQNKAAGNTNQVLVVDSSNRASSSSSSSFVSLVTTSTIGNDNNDGNDRMEKERWWNMAGQTSRRKRQRGRPPTLTLREDATTAVALANPVSTTTRGTTTSNDHTIKKQSRKESSIIGVSQEENPILDIQLLIPSTTTTTTTNTKNDTTTTTPILADITLVNGTILHGIDPTTLHQRHDHAIWMALRKAMNVTASELSAIVGHSVFTTREKLLTLKSGQSSSSSMPPMNRQACEWGLKMEPKALKQYCEVTGNQVHETGLHIRQFWSGSQNDDATTTAAAAAGAGESVVLVGASPDGLVVDAKDQSRGVLEIKSLWGRRNKKELPQFKHCPQRFYDQIQGQLAVCDVEWCDLIMYIPPNTPRQPKGSSAKNYCILRIPRDRLYWQETLLPAIQSFCREVQEIKTTRTMTTTNPTDNNIGNDVPIQND